MSLPAGSRTVPAASPAGAVPARPLPPSGPLGGFHPAVAEWFRRTYPSGPTEAQALGWAAVGRGSDTLIEAPTGSGKTLAAFLVALDRCYRAAARGETRRGTEVVYVSPLRALTVDVAENLTRPLAGIAEVARELGHPVPEIRVAVRNGDTPPAERAAMVRQRPEIVVTTPESLYLLLTSAGGRNVLGTVRTVILDEIHALARDKRGSHLALSLERLDRVVRMHSPEAERPVRIGLSATQRPIETVARLLVGSEPARLRGCEIVDVGHHRRLDMAIELPGDELGPVSTHEQMDDVLSRIAGHIEAQRTTLVFVNTRRMAERVAHRLGEMIGQERVQAHHGSLSMERRLRVEGRLRAGDLKAVVATASLELGIDVGPIELVCQIGSPRAISTWLQRVGRAQHHVGGTPRGRLYPLTRDELVECVALLAAAREGELDATVPPVAPLDILAQQVVAEVAASGPQGIGEDELFSLVRSATCYAELTRHDFDDVVRLVSDGVQTGRGRRGAHVHRDGINKVLRPRRGARLAATTSGGAIPEVADYRVVLEPEDTLVGTVNEDWAIESMAGDVFLLGSHTWRIRRIESGTVRVLDAAGAAPSVPFWLGEAPGRSDELSAAVSRLRVGFEQRLERRDGPSGGSSGLEPSRRCERSDGHEEGSLDWLKRSAGIDDEPARQVAAYLATAASELGGLPATDRLVVERFFDDTGGMQLVVHSPRGSRLNRALGLVLRKRFCRSFDFELQAAASDDAVVLSLGPQHSFPLPELVDHLGAGGVREALVQAVLPTPMFASRWRWNLSRSLVSPRFRGTRHLPPAIQRMEADDLMAAIFPSLAACQENVTGPIEIPEHPIVRQTLDDCFFEAMDLAGLVGFLERLRAGEIETRFVDAVAPSVLAEEILNGRPYTFLDDAPLEERRTRAVQTRRGIPLEARDLGDLPTEVVELVAEQARPEPRDAEELHDLLLSLLVCTPRASWQDWFSSLAAEGRAAEVRRDPESEPKWCAAEQSAAAEALLKGVPAGPGASVEEAAVVAVRGHLESGRPLTVSELAERLGLGAAREAEIRSALAQLEHEGSVLSCRVGGDPAERYSARHLLMRVHAAARESSRRTARTFSGTDLMRFLLEWQHVGPGNRLIGADGLLEVVEQLQGIEAPVQCFEQSILPSRVAGYQAGLLDELCARGEVGFGRLELPGQAAFTPVRRGGATPSPSTPVSLYRREDLSWLLAAVRGPERPELPSVGASAEVLATLCEHGALFLHDICLLTGRMPVEVAEALWDGISRGLVTADGFQGIRALLSGRAAGPSLVTASAPSGAGAGGGEVLRQRRPGRPRPRGRLRPAASGGRWSLLDRGLLDARGVNQAGFEPDELAEALAGQLLCRWGIVFRDIVLREPIGIGWREILWALRRLEARGVVRGGRFVSGFVGEQFALPEAYERLCAVAAAPPAGTAVRLSAADPLNLTGMVLSGPRIPALRTRTIRIVDGVLDPGEALAESQA